MEGEGELAQGVRGDRRPWQQWVNGDIKSQREIVKLGLRIETLGWIIKKN